MTDRPAFLDELDRAASAAQAEEVRFRRSFAEEVARRERARVFAFRRAGFLARMTDACRAAAAGAEAAEADGAAARAAVRRAFAAEFGWHGDSEARARILDRFDAVTAALAAVLAGAAADPAAEMAGFEAWYAETCGGDFLALFDQEPIEAPVVEF